MANATLCETMRNSNKSKVEVKNASGVESTMLTRSRSMESFVNQREWAQLLLEYGNYDRFREAFNQYLIDPSQPIDDFNEEGYVWIQDVQHIVKYCLSKEVPEFILDRFVELSRRFIVQSK